MNFRKQISIRVLGSVALLTILAAGTVANAQGTASQPPLDSGTEKTGPATESQEPADAIAVHEGAGPVDCEGLLAQENNAQTNTQVTASRTNDSGQSDQDAASNPHRIDQPGQDTQVSTLEECRAQQDANLNRQADGAGAE